jgi:metal-responsive CopG/Arc/MetJ family transcriptional regulator
MKVAENSKRRWKTIQLPEELLQRVDVVVAAPELGYTSRAEFIKEAVRLRVEAMEKILRERTGRI